jgi:hypothetical protein
VDEIDDDSFRRLYAFLVLLFIVGYMNWGVFWGYRALKCGYLGFGVFIEHRYKV